MPTETLSPDAIVSSTNLSGAVTDIQDAVQTALFEETWTGADNDPWPTARWETATETHASCAVDIQGNKGRMLAAGGAYVSAHIESKSGALTDFDLTVDFQQASGSEQYHVLAFRHDGSWHTDETPNNSYWAEISADTDLYLAKRTTGTRTNLGTVAKSFSTSAWRLRVQCIGTALKLKAWLASGGEPGTWDIEQTDSDHTSGIISFLAVNGGDGTAKSIVWDSLIVEAA